MKCLPFYSMGTIKDLVDGFASLVDGFDGMLRKTMEESRGDVYDLVTDQLYSGINGRDKPLRPTYLHDPWFKSDEAGKWKNNGRGYAMWKKEEHPPTPSFQGYPPRDVYTPNLIITGEFYSSIRVNVSPEGLKIGSETTMGKDIEKKYGSIIFGLGPRSRGYFIEYILNPALKEYFSKFGVL